MSQPEAVPSPIQAGRDVELKRENWDSCSRQVDESFLLELQDCSAEAMCGLCTSTTSTPTLLSRQVTSSSRSRSSSPALSEHVEVGLPAAASRGRTPSPCPTEDQEANYSHHFHFVVHRGRSWSWEQQLDVFEESCLPVQVTEICQHSTADRRVYLYR